MDLPAARCFATWILITLLLVTATKIGRAQTEHPPGSSTIHDALQPFVDRKELAGAVVLVADPARVLCIEAVGSADIANAKPMPPDALFWIASQSKPITATALMMLVDDGKVVLDDPVSKYLPEFQEMWLLAESAPDHRLLKRPARPILVRDLLRHTSGLPFASALERPTLDQLPLRVAVGSYAMTPLEYEPGTKYQYSNAGINTAGRIIEVVSRQPYEEFLETRLFRPLGMSDTTFRPSTEQVGRLARSYKPAAGGSGLEETRIGQLFYPLDDRSRQPMPAGGLFSTAKDVGRFCQMILNGGRFEGRRYLSEASLREMTRKQTGDAIADEYGLGWGTGGGTFGHGGAFSTNMMIDPGRRLVTVYLVQHAGFPGEGGKSLGAFLDAARTEFGHPR
jgi:CubicO group peptidase (beta-lactamase class C family)